MVQEVQELGDSVEFLHRKLQEAEAQHQQLLRTRSNLEQDLHIKVNSLFIDREKCLGMRRSFPISATIKYWVFSRPHSLFIVKWHLCKSQWLFINLLLKVKIILLLYWMLRYIVNFIEVAYHGV